jgi:hypothetical protein
MAYSFGMHMWVFARTCVCVLIAEIRWKITDFYYAQY